MTNIRFKAFLLDYVVRHRVDMFELIRNNHRQDYNRNNPLYPLSKLGWFALKLILEGRKDTQMG